MWKIFYIFLLLSNCVVLSSSIPVECDDPIPNNESEEEESEDISSTLSEELKPKSEYSSSSYDEEEVNSQLSEQFGDDFQQPNVDNEGPQQIQPSEVPVGGSDGAPPAAGTVWQPGVPFLYDQPFDDRRYENYEDYYQPEIENNPYSPRRYHPQLEQNIDYINQYQPGIVQNPDYVNRYQSGNEPNTDYVNPYQPKIEYNPYSGHQYHPENQQNPFKSYQYTVNNKGYSPYANPYYY